MLRTSLVLALALVAAAPLMAQKSQPKEGLRIIKYPLAVDGFCQLSPSVMVDKNDYRENLAMFGIRPAFVFVLPEEATDDSGKINMAAYKEMLGAIDDIGKRMAKKADVVAVYYLEENGDPLKPPAHVTQIKLKYASLMAMEFWSIKDMSSDALDLKFNMHFNSMLGAMNWLYLSGPGELGDAGMGSKDPKLEDNLKRVEKRIPLKGVQAEIIEALARWNIGDAVKKISKGETAAKEDEAAWFKNQREVAEKMESSYRTLVADPENERKYFVEYGEALANLAKMMKGHEHEKTITDELNALKKTDEYKMAVKARPKFEELKKEYYSIHVYMTRGDSMQAYYKRRGEAFKAVKTKLQAFAQEFEGIGYSNKAMSMVLTVEFYEALGRGEEGKDPNEEE